VVFGFGVARYGSEYAAEQYAYLIEQPHGPGKQRLGNDIRRGQYHADDEAADDDVGADFPQLGHSYHTRQYQQHRGHRDLEGQSERQEQRHDKVEIAVDIRHHRHAIGRGAGKEAEDQREHHEVGEGHAAIEQDDARGQQRQGDALLVLVQTRRDKTPDLVQDKGHGQEQRTD